MRMQDSECKVERKHHCQVVVVDVGNLERFYAMLIFLGAISGVVFGKVTVRTPFSRDALISFSYGSHVGDRIRMQRQVPY
jgi:hypothetical protein